jgi:hypothetical protein
MFEPDDLLLALTGAQVEFVVIGEVAVGAPSRLVHGAKPPSGCTATSARSSENNRYSRPVSKDTPV